METETDLSGLRKREKSGYDTELPLVHTLSHLSLQPIEGSLDRSIESKYVAAMSVILGTTCVFGENGYFVLDMKLVPLISNWSLYKLIKSQIEKSLC